MDFSYHPWILRTLRTTDFSYHSRTFRTIAEQWREHETRRRWQAIDSPYGLVKASDRQTDGRAIAYSALSIYAICSRALIKPLNTHANLNLINAVNRSDPSDRVERTAAARYIGDVRRSTDAITNSTEDRTAVAILKQFQPAVLQ